MPSYGGGKAKLGNEIYNVIRDTEDEENWKGNTYFEPFCGMCGVGIHFMKEDMLEKVSVRRKVKFCDANEDLILMWQKLKKGWKLPAKCCSRKKYEELKVSKKHSALRGFMGIACAYSGIFFSGYRPSSDKQDFYGNTRKGLIDMGKDISNYGSKVQFLKARDYRQFKPKGNTIYVDPPYKDNNIQSKHFDNFDHDAFWDVMRMWSKDNLVFISEYQAPKDFEEIWRKDFGSVYSKKIKKNTEKLFMYKYGL